MKPLKSYDFDQLLEIKHENKSHFLITHASFTHDNSKIYVYTEHCGYFMFFKDDLKLFRYKPFYSKNTKWITLIKTSKENEMQRTRNTPKTSKWFLDEHVLYSFTECTIHT